MSDFLIYGQLVFAGDAFDEPLPSTSTTEPTMLQMYAARILPGPPPPVARLPRPDDPTPRKPPAHLLSAGSKRKRDASSASLSFNNGIKRAKSGYFSANPGDEDEAVRLAREVMLRGPQASSQLRGKSAANVFKVPPLPARSGSLNTLESGSQSSDVFGSVATLNQKGKGKAASEDVGLSELEKANKMVFARSRSSHQNISPSSPGDQAGSNNLSCQSQCEERRPGFPGVVHHHISWGDLRIGMLVCQLEHSDEAEASQRSVVRTQAVNIRVVDRLLEAHARIYVNGNGENHVSSGQGQKG